ncbi:hypothetical protein HK096_005507 [Nowakowskiella sp. JEL0078]|nr:hypothetical protein HK096_005507 [Nowakowskiella sp. JEL0078]
MSFSPFSDSIGTQSPKPSNKTGIILVTRNCSSIKDALFLPEAYVSGLPLTETEATIYSEFFKQADVSGSGLIGTMDAVNFMKKSNLPVSTLNEIWGLIDTEKRGFLNQGSFFKGLKLIAAAQTGKVPNISLFNTNTPLPKFDQKLDSQPTGLRTNLSIQRTGAIVPQLTGAIVPQMTGSLAPQRTGVLTPQRTGAIVPQLTGNLGSYTISSDERERYLDAWKSCSPIDGKVTGEAARELFLKSGLSNDTLAKIWMLVDTGNVGKLELNQFMVAMNLIMRMKLGTLTTVPSTIPPALFQAVASGNLNDLTASVAIPKSPTLIRSLAPAPISNYSSPLSSFASNTEEWKISEIDRKQYDKYFDTLDEKKNGFITGDQAYGFMTKSKLSETILAQVWALADTTANGQLSKEEFGIAMFLIKKVMTGITLPAKLPTSLLVAKPSATEDLLGLGFGALNASELSMDLLSDAFSSPPPLSSSISNSLSTNSFNLTSGFPSMPISFQSRGDSLHELEKELEIRRNELKEVEKQYSTVVPASEETKRKRTEMETELKEITDQKHELTIKVSSTRAVMEAERLIVAERESMLVRERQMIDLGREEIAKGSRFVEALTFKKQSLEQQSEQNNIEITNIQKQINDYTDTGSELQTEVNKLNEEVKKQISLYEINMQRLQKAQEECQQLLLERHQLQQQLEQGKEKVRLLSNQAVTQESEKRKLEKERAVSLAQLNSLTASATQINATISSPALDRSESFSVLSSPPPIPPLGTKPTGPTPSLAKPALSEIASPVTIKSVNEDSTISQPLSSSPLKSPQSKKDAISSILELSKAVAPSGPLSKTIQPTTPGDQTPKSQPLSPQEVTSSPDVKPQTNIADDSKSIKSVASKKSTLDMTNTDFANVFPDVLDFESGFPNNQAKEIKTDGTETTPKPVELVVESEEKKVVPKATSIANFDEELKAFNTITAVPQQFDDSTFQLITAGFTDDAFKFDTSQEPFFNSSLAKPAFVTSFDAFGSDPFALPITNDSPPKASAADLDAAFGGFDKNTTVLVSSNADFSSADYISFSSLPSTKLNKEVNDDLDEVKKLVGMGFPKEESVEALEKHGFDFSKALEYLLEKKGLQQ